MDVLVFVLFFFEYNRTVGASSPSLSLLGGCGCASLTLRRGGATWRLLTLARESKGRAAVVGSRVPCAPQCFFPLVFFFSGASRGRKASLPLSSTSTHLPTERAREMGEGGRGKAERRSVCRSARLPQCFSPVFRLCFRDVEAARETGGNLPLAFSRISHGKSYSSKGPSKSCTH
jgi:hypothetical protein